ncbi:MAG: hypothetical protein RBT11_12625 [Desulfobacterales bacterium]|jgi:hypothetical protein|nr:hypothetical protein [Desulfobacterales bacterium]
MAVKSGNKKEIAANPGHLTQMFRVIRNVGKANKITGRLRRGNP